MGLHFLFFGANLVIWLFILRYLSIRWQDNGFGRALAFLH